MRIALGLEYDGAGFSGWQTQPDGRGIQDCVESSLAAIAGHPVSTICAGRTDAGVHALDQVVHFDTEASRPLTAWVRGTNRFLPPTVSARWARVVGEDFHARFAARRRTYHYWLLNDPVPSPIAHGRATWIHRSLDEAAMQKAAALLVGTHDFTSFRSSECQAASPVRELQRLDVRRFGRWLQITATADAFLHHMMRNIVGTLVAVGSGRRGPEWAGEVLAARDRARAAPTLAADGLYLARVEYDQRFGLPAPGVHAPYWIDANPDQDLRTDPRD